MRGALMFAAGLLLGSLLTGAAASAASYPFYSLAGRFNGAPKVLTATTDGYLNVVSH